MADADTLIRDSIPGKLTARIIVGAVLIAGAVAAEYAGGTAFTLLVAGAALLMFAEWAGMFRIGRGWRFFGLVLLAGVALLSWQGQSGLAIVVLAAAAGLLLVAARAMERADKRPRHGFWIAAGLLYAGLPAVALIWLRAVPDGLALTLWTLAVVWATDIFAFVAGRGIGGPKLLPRISPNKTWAGLFGGMAGAGVVGAGVAVVLDLPMMVGGLAALPLAALAQGGDLFESWLKRRTGVKDSGDLLPGHGGVLDRLDGLVPVALVVAGFVALSEAA